MDIHNEFYPLNNGVTIPKLGLGTWLIDDKSVTAVVKAAIQAGYRHIDTAEAYGNEAGVGRGIQQSGVARDNLFITTKLAAEHKDYASATAAIDESLIKLGLDYLDLMIIHAPEPWANFHAGEHYFEGNREAWRALEAAHDAGKIRAIGLSNFEVIDVQNILDHSRIKPQVNQVLAHIGNVPTAVIAFDAQHDILTEAYSPVAHGAMLNEPKIVAMAAKYGVSVPQLAIKYDLQLNLLPLPKSASVAHLQANAELGFTISDADMAELNQIQFTDYGEDKSFPVYAGKKDWK
ncbi:aldo/keto reductase [Lacticaseibacillus manihotivorans]|jgi:diketogulonate reductase-like aldo/keto reductase|uniref:Aldo keto reductase n=2 Tax=Lacticaseibacillus manihotivorans TaxID=88233 RepID=A0A0R1REH0_9LACO|nr:aldo/keto reductase [Lacticaseibacillus manihotivorans]KRL52629.1 aldo keto reductase [Lacticaseibacillus manihotivorans DSM 13343 = JCM 12514]QFQ90020.1 aldo/keto reductase [Lacticaseibacillus manihotivorans]